MGVSPYGEWNRFMNFLGSVGVFEHVRVKVSYFV